MKVRLYFGDRQYTFLQDFETIAKVVSMALGGKSEDKPPPVPKNKAELAGMMASVFGKKQ